MSVFISVLLLLAGFFLQPLAHGQELDESIPIQHAPGVEDLPENERFIATLRTWGDLPGPVHFEVLPFDAPPTARAIFQGVTDRNGLARVELPRTAADGWHERSGINARVVEPGYQLRQGGRRIHVGKGSGRLHFNLPLHSGSTQFVHVVDGEGQGANAYLEWRRAGDPRSVLSPSITMEDAFTKGWRALHFTQTMDVDVLATREMHPEGGAGSALNISLVLGKRPDPLTITLRGEDQLACVVRYADGQPAKHASFRMFWAGPQDPDELVSICARPLDEWALQSQGLIRKYVKTGPGGELIARGLRPGFYKFQSGRAWVHAKAGKNLFPSSPANAQAESCSLQIPRPNELPPSPFDGRPKKPERDRFLGDGPDIPDGAPRGTLDIRAVGRGAGIQRDVHLFVTPLNGGSQIANTRFLRSRLRVDLPPGPYRVVAIGGSPGGGCGFDSHEPRRLGRSEKVVQVFEDKLTEEKIEIGVGGFLEIDLKGHAVANDRLVTLRDLTIPPGNWYGPGLRSSRPELHLVARDGRKEEVSWYPQSGHSNRGAEIYWPFGESHRSECLPTGTFQLIARMPGGRTAQAEVSIQSGKTTKVTLRF